MKESRHSLFICLAVILCLPIFLWGSTEKEYVLGPGDVIEIIVWENDDLYRTVEISQSGYFTFPLVGKVKGGGHTVFGLENKLTEHLADGYLNDPDVSVSVKQYNNQKVFLFGEVKNPGSYVVKGEAHVLELISDAGGFTDFAGRSITVVREIDEGELMSAKPQAANPNQQRTITVTLDQMNGYGQKDKFLVKTGDSIYIPRAEDIYIVGEVNKPGKYYWKNTITVREAISMAGGTTDKGAINRVKITRKVDGKEIDYNPKLDELVEPYDIIRVPESYF